MEHSLSAYKGQNRIIGGDGKCPGSGRVSG